MSVNDSQRMRLSLQRRVIELIERELPHGWSCQADGDGILLSGDESTDGELLRFSLEKLYRGVEQEPEQRRQLLYETVERVQAIILGKTAVRDLQGKESNVYPVLRHASFAGQRTEEIVTRKHTEETVIAFALDQGSGYVLVDREMLSEAGWTEEQLFRQAMENLKALPIPVKTQELGGNLIHFISPSDGYAASRILLNDLLEQYDRTKKGKSLGVAVPHQDVLIIADLADEQGTHLLARLTYDFATKGPVPITPMPFFFEEGGLTPYLVVQHNGKAETKRKRKG